MVDDHTLEKISHSGKRISANILPLVESVMVDYHTRKKISHSGKRI
jgi:hypothetical protein